MADDIHFEVHPSVVFKLGEELISDEIQALVELAKNSYDADATYVDIVIETPDEDDDKSGKVEVDDDGVGMNMTEIRRGWLTISYSPKRVMKAKGITTDKERTPLGDKGLGRLGVQRLGDHIEIETLKEGASQGYRVIFDWREFRDKQRLSAVPVQVRPARLDREQGTLIRITHLRDGGRWALDHARLQTEMSKLISPYRGVDDFAVYVTVDGVELDLAEVGDQLRRTAQVQYDLSFDGNTFDVRGRMRLAALRPNTKAERAMFRQQVEADGGEALFSWLSSKPGASDLRLRRGAKGWFVSFRRTLRLDDEVVGVQFTEDDEIASPGPFEGEIDGFNLSAGAIADQEIFERAAYKDLVREMHGIRVYRDGFGVRVDEDWLGLGKSWTSGPSWFGLRPSTTMGYLAISARENAQLIETTDREGFVSTPHFRNLRLLMDAFLKFSQEAQQFLGRQTAQFRSSLDEPDDDEEEDTSDLTSTLDAALERAAALRTEVDEIRIRLAEGSDEVTDLVEDLDDEEVEGTLRLMQNNMLMAADLLGRLEASVEELATFKSVGARLQMRLDRASEQLGQAYETVSLGLTAEALSHEIANIANRLARRTSEVSSYLKSKPDRRLSTFADHVATTVAALRRQLIHLAPSLRYVRERRESIPISEVVHEVVEYHASRWQGARPSLRIKADVDDDFTIRMNRGKVFQVIDNLILNSEYWLREEVRAHRLASGEITITIADPYVFVEDNGAGVSRTVESSLFEPFVSAKPKSTGRGLGLFIVRQLLQSEGCDVDLMPERNARRRRYIFRLDLSGARES